MTRERADDGRAADRMAYGEGALMSQIEETTMAQIPRQSQAAKEQTIRLARMISASTGITPAGFSVLCRTILRDSRRKDFQELYGEAPVLRQSVHNAKLDA